MISFISIISSLICRIIINTIMMFDFQQDLNESFNNGTWLLVYYLLTDVWTKPSRKNAQEVVDATKRTQYLNVLFGTRR
ncbi:UNKNOWN [Stylonychia lemnae]|uniref:Uncharacterized protein n=1 Tax=Stylonychia lemnae TaxID=5949 RepID=A0A077ZRC1_STYLE|nr:UNKNOWN [Stylonychia lemnae]|eukprot:CDW72442.1 UNKNOWN [Stylonychia lemnae]